MTIYPVLIIGCLLCTFSPTTSDDVPVLLISCGNTPLYSLPVYLPYLDTIEFKELLSTLWADDLKVVVAFEEELSLEDIRMKDADGEHLFTLFEKSSVQRFFPLVHQPENALGMLLDDGFSIINFNNRTYPYESDGKVITLANLTKNIPDRRAALLEHNNNMSDLFFYLCSQYANVVLVYSGKMNRWTEKLELPKKHKLVTRHLLAVDSAPFILKDPKTGKALVYSASYPTLTVNNETFPIEGTNTEAFGDLRDSLLKIGSTFTHNKIKITLRFRFEKTTFTWALKSIEYETGSTSVLLEPKNNQIIGAPIGLSYFSKGPVVFSNDSTVLTFPDIFQVQPWLSTSPGSEKFNDPQAQDSFFTPPILAGLFVSALMLFIVTWGITMIMDIKTMDRFDDPKGKTITINVAE